VEWLLATHENERGPIDWGDESQHKRLGLDLRGADLCHINLIGLPLAGIYGGLHRDQWLYSSAEQCEAAALQLERADLRFARLEGADLHYAHLERADLRSAHLEKTDLTKAHLQSADLNSTHFEEANASAAQLQGAYVGSARLEKAHLKDVHLEGADLYKAHLEGAILCGAFFDSATTLNDIAFGSERCGKAFMVDVRWNDVNLAVVNWSAIPTLGDEYVAHQSYTIEGIVKSRDVRIDEYRAAVRAYRQLAVVLRNQGLNEDAAHFAYRAQKLQRKVLLYQGTRKIGQYLLSYFLDLLAGYGYRPWRSFIAYLLVITTFAIAYFVIGHTIGPVLSPLGSFVFSITSFHGRGFFPGGIKLDDPLTVLAAIEAFVGLLIEVTFIATLTQRLFGK
jgi:uncharacterized protein YjbI with pentapeptide repeats